MKELATWLSVTVPSVRAWVQAGVIPFHRIGPRLVRFRRDAVEAWLAENLRKQAPLSA